ncbi:cell division protein FtsL [Roseovarius faecimaris]|nr:cell division protein FtsL [Roseovarius faecimaris]
MRSFLVVITAVAVIALAFWAYRENYETQEAQAEARDLMQEIARERQRLRMLNAEWAYLNRPERLRDLAELNFDKLGLVPLRPDQFGRIDQVAFPREEEELPILNPVEVSNMEQFP